MTKELVKKTCPICTETFLTSYDKKLYCSLDCEMEAGRIRARKWKHNHKGRNKK